MPQKFLQIQRKKNEEKRENHREPTITDSSASIIEVKTKWERNVNRAAWSNKHIAASSQRSRACVRVRPCVQVHFWLQFTCLARLELNFLIGLVRLIRPPWRLQMVTVTEWNQHPVKIWLGGDLAPAKQIMVAGAGGTRNEWAESFLSQHHHWQC